MHNYSTSVVIPARNDKQSLQNVLSSINNQTLLPNQVIIVDSSTNEEVKKFIEDYNDTIPIIYHHEQKAYPGKARNLGVELANGEWIAFLDSKTIPNGDWLERYRYLVQAYHSDVVFGVTKFDAKSAFQKAIRATTYGKIGHHTVPGTLIKKKIFIDSGGFFEHVRMGEDIEWRDRLINNGLNIHKPDKPVVTYYGLSDNFVSTINKYIKSAYHTARLNILMNVKDAYLSLVLVLSAIILPKWNYLIGGWDSNPFFIHHVTKIYIISLVFLFLVYQLFHYLFFRNMTQAIFSRTLRLLLLIFLTIAALNWNAVIAGWVEDAVFYIPHITKIYVLGVLFSSLIYRGIYLPLNRKVEPDFLFPFTWVVVGIVGLFLDLVKAPGYIAGAVLSLIRIEFIRVDKISN